MSKIKVDGEIKNAQFESHPDGRIIIDSIEVAHTLQCCHCGNHFISIRGSGTTRGFCRRCMKVTCGKKECDVCMPFEKMLETIEGKKHPFIRAFISKNL